MMVAEKKAVGEGSDGGENKAVPLGIDLTTFGLPVKPAAVSFSVAAAASCLPEWGAFVAAGVRHAKHLDEAIQFLYLFANLYRAQLEANEQPAFDCERIRTLARGLSCIRDVFSSFVASVRPEDVPFIPEDGEVSW